MSLTLPKSGAVERKSGALEPKRVSLTKFSGILHSHCITAPLTFWTLYLGNKNFRCITPPSQIEEFSFHNKCLHQIAILLAP